MNDDDFESLKWRRIRAITTAKQLQYDDSVIEKLKKAQTESQITRILISARHDEKCF